MTYIYIIVTICNNLNENDQKEVLDFAEFLKIKKEQELNSIRGSVRVLQNPDFEHSQN